MNSIDEHLIALLQDGIARMACGDEKELSKIIDSDAWDAIPKREKLKIGKDFLSAVLNDAFPQLRFKEKRSDNHTIYKKIPDLF